MSDTTAAGSHTAYRFGGVSFERYQEAMWAMYFECRGIPWMAYPEPIRILPSGEEVRSAFLLPECGTYIVFEPDCRVTDWGLLERAARELLNFPPTGVSHPYGPALMAVNSLPWSMKTGDFGWPGWHWENSKVYRGEWGFGAYHAKNRPWRIDDSGWALEDDTSAAIHYPVTLRDYEYASTQDACQIPYRHWVVELPRVPVAKDSTSKVHLALHFGDDCDVWSYGGLICNNTDPFFNNFVDHDDTDSWYIRSGRPVSCPRCTLFA